MGHIAKRNPTIPKICFTSLIYKQIIRLEHWHADCTSFLRETPLNAVPAKVPEMNMTLSLLNAAALVALVAFHFQGDGSQSEAVKSESVAVQAQPHHLLQQTPRFAAMPGQGTEAILAHDNEEAVPVSRSERWVF